MSTLNKTRLQAITWLCLLLLMAQSCGDGVQKPIDGKTRRVIDSLYGVETRQMKQELDSFCLQERKRLLPHLIDSIKQIRKKEIEEKLRNIPK